MHQNLKFDGKGFICALLTSRCHVGCSHCMFSANMDEEKNAFNTMTKERVDRLMNLVTDSNTGYLLISGGGEIFLEPELIYQIVEKTSADITWLATSAFWAKNYISARNILKNIYNSYIKGIKNNYNKKIYIRVSVDSQHIKQISNFSCDKFLYLMNIINIFENDYSQSKNFLLQFHCIEGEEGVIEELKEKLDARIINKASSTHYFDKITESAITIITKCGYSFEISFAKLLISDIAVDLSNKKLIYDRIQRWEKDAFFNERGMPYFHINKNGSKGTDILVIYDGRVAGGWQIEMPDVKINIDVDSYSKIMHKTLSDPCILATMENGLSYRFNIIDEVCEKASIRAKAVNIRDYSSITLFEEDSLILYYTIAVLQDYINKGRIIDISSSEVYNLINIQRNVLKELYKKSNYDIIRQFEDTEIGFKSFSELVKIFSKNKNRDLFLYNMHHIRAINNIKISNRTIDKWRILIKRVINNWYDIKSWDNSVMSCLNDLESLLRVDILKNKHPYEGLSRL